MESWNDMCIFFDRDPSPKNYRGTFKFRGTKRALLPHQIFAVYWMFIQWATHDGGLIQDEQGLGKTTVAIAFAILLTYLTRMWRDYLKHPHLHLSADEAEAGHKRCQRAKEWNLPFACPCETRRFPAVLRKKLEAMPILKGIHLFLVPPVVLTSWTEEVQKILDLEDSGSPLGGFKLYMAHSMAPAKLKLDSGAIQSILANKDGSGQVSQLGTMIVTSTLSVRTHLVDPCDDAWLSQYRPKAKPVWEYYAPVNSFHVANCVLDESHLLRNDGTITDFLYNRFRCEDGRQFENTPVARGGLWLLSGTPWEKGPMDMNVYFTWFRRKWAFALRRAKNGEYRTNDVLESFTKFDEKEVQNLHDRIIKVYNQFTKKKTSTNTKELRKMANQVAKLLMPFSIRRTTKQKWWDHKPIVALPELLDEYENFEPVSPEITDSLNRLGTTRANEILKDHSHSLANWNRRGRKTPKPDKMAMIKRLENIRPYVSIPYLRDMENAGVLTHLTLEENIEAFRIPADMKNHPWYNHLDAMLKGSSRLQHIVKELKRICTKSYVPTGGAALEERIRKLVIVSVFPIITLCSALVLMKVVQDEGLKDAFGEPIRIGVLHSKIPMKKRQLIIDGFQENVKLNEVGAPYIDPATLKLELIMKKDRPTVLVASAGVMGIGLTLHRAHDMIIMEPQFQQSTLLQVMKRSHRIGQTETTKVQILRCDAVEFEKLVWDRTTFRKYFGGMVNYQATVDQVEETDSDRSMRSI